MSFLITALRSPTRSRPCILKSIRAGRLLPQQRPSPRRHLSANMADKVHSETSAEPLTVKSERQALSDFGWDPDMTECTTFYQPGGYHVVYINQLLHERYRVLNKLGWGTYSTIWLARDEVTQRLVSVKIGISDPKSPRHEASTLRNLATAFAAQDTRGTKWIPIVLDSFDVQGPNGCHPCYVREPAKAPITYRRGREPNESKELEIQIARSQAAQLTLTIAFLHNHGYVHGDLQAPNVLVQGPSDFCELSDDRLQRFYGKPKIEPVVYKKGPLPRGVPSHLVIGPFLSEKNDLGPHPARIMLSDFGETFQPAQEARTYTNVSLPYRAPEIVMNIIDKAGPRLPVSFASDIWSLACVYWEFFCGYSLFCVWNGSQDTLLHEMKDHIGSLPPEWWQRWQMRHYWYHEDGTSLHEPLSPLERSFDERLQDYRKIYELELIAPDERKAFLSLLRQMLALKQEDRITIDEVLKSEWMVKWALPAFEEDPVVPY